jgi:hypothetical protein
VKLHLDTAHVKPDHGRNALYPLDHTGSDGAEKKFSRIEGIGAACHVCVEHDLGILAVRNASVSIDSSGRNFVFERHAHPDLPADGLRGCFSHMRVADSLRQIKQPGGSTMGRRSEATS